MSLQNGLVFKGERLVIPTRIREDMKARVHASHIGIQSCLGRAKEALYWPGMNTDIQEYIACCDVCNSHPSTQAKEPLICHPITVTPWEKIWSPSTTIRAILKWTDSTPKPPKKSSGSWKLTQLDMGSRMTSCLTIDPLYLTWISEVCGFVLLWAQHKFPGILTHSLMTK